MTRPLESFVGQPVRSLQTMLRVLAEADSSRPSLVPDGIFGRNTQRAVTHFQRTQGLPVTGIADALTWERLSAEYDKAKVEVLPAEPLQIILNPGQVLKKGQSGYAVSLVQVMLTALAEVYASLAAPLITGILDDQTSESVISFQYLSDLPQTGEVDKVTWKHLALQYPLAVNHRESKNVTRR